MSNEQPSGANFDSIHRRSLASPRFVLVLAVVICLVIAGLVTIGRSHDGKPYAITGGSPYPLEVLLASNVVKPLPARIHVKMNGELANIPSRSDFVKALDSQGVSVTFDGTTYSSDEIALGESTCLQAAIEVATTNAYVQGLNPTTAVSELEASSFCLDQSIALAVFKQAAEEAAVKSGNGATLAQAQVFAQQQLVAQESFDSLPNSPQLPSGVTAQSLTMCSACILGYQQDLNLQYE